MLRSSIYLLLGLFLAMLLTTSEGATHPVGDLNGDFKVDAEDLQLFSEQWLTASASLADLNGDEEVGMIDFALLAEDWHQSNIPLVINEFMASNNSKYADPQDEYDDWIEIYNAGQVAIDVGGMYLTDDLAEPAKWQIPDNNPSLTTISAGGYLVIWADGDTQDTGLHTNFNINAAGEELGLFNTDANTVIDSISFGQQTVDISYGRYPDASGNLRFFGYPTPGQENNGAYLGVVEDIKFSHDRGFYDLPFSVTINTETEGATIYYTLDGSEPFDMQHGVPTGIIYNAPILITTTTCLRAIAFKPDWKSTNIDTHTYIFVDDVAQQPTDPVGWPSDWGEEQEFKVFYITGKIPSDYEMDPRVVNNTLPGYSVRDALLDIPTVSIAMLPEDFITNNDENGIYANPFKRWERKCSVEYILPDGTNGFQEDCKIEVHGGASRYPQRMQKHSLRLTFTSQYGPAKLKYPLFPESPVDEFNQLVLRASFTDSWGLVSWDAGRYRPNDSQYIHDVWMKESLRDMGQPSSYGNFVHLYVNGLYFGLHNFTERLSDDFLADHLGGEPEDWEINQDFSSPGPRWRTMISINPSTIDGYTQIQEYLDVENFADYMLLHFYADSEDWPHHNGYAAVNTVSGDGKYRFFVWDQEIVLDKHGLGATRIDRTGGAGSVFQNMRTSEEFRLLFADRVYKHCFNGGALSATASQDRYLKIANWIDKAIVAESARWGDTQMSTSYGSTIPIPSNPNNPDDPYYPMPPHGPDYYFTREDSWVLERDNVINNYIPAIHNAANYYALINILRSENLYPDIDPPVFHINGSYQHGGQISAGDMLSMTTTIGEIYYTLDGSEPHLPETSGSIIGSSALIAESTTKQVLIPTGNIGEAWRGGETFDDSSWSLCTGSPGGIGYERSSGYEGLISLDVQQQMYGQRTSCYVRIPFNLDDNPADFNFMTLRVQYDDGFVVYLNGTEIQRALFTGTPTWNSQADGNHEAQGTDSFDVSDHIDVLRAGDNILAIHALNVSTTSSDFIILAELIAGQSISGNGGGASGSAIAYTAPITLNKTTQVKARVLQGNTWSALNEAIFAVGPVKENLRITEIMYNPGDYNEPNDPNPVPSAAEGTEYIELTNIGSETINLNLVKFTNGVDFTFSDIELAPGGFVLIVKDESAFLGKYPSFSGLIAGEYSGSLNNAGERIELQDAIGQPIHNFRYRDNWYDITDGLGFSLTIKDPVNTDPDVYGDKADWRPSATIDGSPGYDDSDEVPVLGSVVINEILTHSHLGEPDWIELHNTTDHTINIGGWFLSDDDSDFTKYEIALGTAIPANGYIVFYEDVHFGNPADSGCHVPFALSENGETLYLHSGRDGQLTGYSEQENFGASETGVAFGRYGKSTGTYNFVAMSENTVGYANAYPLVGPVVINEIMYHPDIEGDAEYVELLNITGDSVLLYDSITGEPWRFTDDPDDPGLEFLFPTGPAVTVGPGEYILLVKDVEIYRARFGEPLCELVFEWGSGKLSNGGEKIQLSKPGDVDGQGVRQWIRVDRVVYSDGSHPVGEDLWPMEADGGGLSLSRMVPSDYGNDVVNWQAAEPSPGQTNP